MRLHAELLRQNVVVGEMTLLPAAMLLLDEEDFLALMLSTRAVNQNRGFGRGSTNGSIGSIVTVREVASNCDNAGP